MSGEQARGFDEVLVRDEESQQWVRTEPVDFAECLTLAVAAAAANTR